MTAYFTEKDKEESNNHLKEASGNVISEDKLVAFIYDLIKDHLPSGVVQDIIDDCQVKSGDTIVFSNGYLAEYAKYLAKRLK